ncbi:MAG: hypothetical protein EBT36_12815, partial [Betaproteobacteria bacterium]|nr:hypothetical protein [Betaproteobacteria bacterium]
MDFHENWLLSLPSSSCASNSVVSKSFNSPALSPEWLAAACGFAAVLGHVYPVFHGFRGGKGVATVLGVPTNCVYAFAWVCELLHVASLVVDDLPS